MANGDDITFRNETMPHWPKGMKLRHKVQCLLGHHLRETRKCSPTHKIPNMELRDQCGRCGALL